MKFKVGDQVRVHSWEYLEKTYGLDVDGDIGVLNPVFIASMKEYTGNVYRIDTVYSNCYKLRGCTRWNFPEGSVTAAFVYDELFE